MPAGPDVTDAYHKYLFIPPAEQPPNHYRLLGVALFEEDPGVISDAARARCQHLRTVNLHRPELTEPLQNEVMSAKQCLLNPSRRSRYDAQLRAELAQKNPSPEAASVVGPSESRPALLLQDDEAASGFADDSWMITPPAVAERPNEWVVGNSTEASIRVRAPWVSRRHCRLWEQGGETWVEDLGSLNGTFVNEVGIGTPTRLHTEDLVTLGRKTRLPWPLPPNFTGRDLRVFLIGRSPECDFRLEEKSVSQNHAQLLVEGDIVVLQDLDSLNGTRVGSLDNLIRQCELQGHVSVYFGAQKVFAQDLIRRVCGP